MSESLERNPGPSWGFACLRSLTRILPAWLLNTSANIGAAVAWLLMPEQRRASKAYLEALYSKPCGSFASLRHFAAFTRSMFAKLRVGEGAEVRFEWDSSEDAKAGALLFEDKQLLLGTFHVGASELLGFYGTSQTRKIAMVRQQRANAGDIERLVARTDGRLSIVWTQNGESVVFAIRDLLESGYTLAMQCDRAEHASKSAMFNFLGGEHAMPTTIYRLAHLYNLPVCFFFAFPGGDELSLRVKAYPAYEPSGNSMSSAHEHFQGVLNWLENFLKEHPEQWYNFQPLQGVTEGKDGAND